MTDVHFREEKASYPAGWQQRRLKLLVSRFFSGGTPSTSQQDYWDGDIPWVSPKDMKSSSVAFSADKITALALADNNLPLLDPGHVLMVVRSGILRHSIPIAVNSLPVSINQDIKAMRLSPDIDPFYFRYFVDGLQNHLLNLWRKPGTTVESLEYDYYSEHLVPVPPLDTQHRIARFLDEKTARIDGLIEKKRALLDRLAEKRQALITRAVTKGLNPDIPMKPSGIDWLGDIPAHWDVFLVKRRFDIQYGIGGEIDRSIEQGTRLLSLPNITKEGRFWLEEVPFTEAATPDDLLREGDLLFNWRNGSTQHLGKTVRFDLSGEWSHVSFLLRLRAKHQDTYSGFLRYFLNGLRETDFFAYAKAGVNNTFNLFELRNLPVISPPTISEQQEIADYLDESVSALDTASDSISASILCLDEYRSALITAAVNGQIAELP